MISCGSVALVPIELSLNSRIGLCTYSGIFISHLIQGLYLSPWPPSFCFCFTDLLFTHLCTHIHVQCYKQKQQWISAFCRQRQRCLSFSYCCCHRWFSFWIWHWRYEWCAYHGPFCQSLLFSWKSCLSSGSYVSFLSYDCCIGSLLLWSSMRYVYLYLFIIRLHD